LEQRFSGIVFTLTGGLLIWAAAFLGAYVFASVACARGFANAAVLGIAIVPAGVGVASFAALAGIGAVTANILRRSSRANDASPAIRDVALIVCLLGATGIVWNALPAFIVAARC